MSSSKKLRLTAYLRVSTAGQASDGYGLDVQETDARRWAQSNNARIVGICADKGISGTVDALDRDGLACAIASVRDGRADGVLVASLSRLGRTLTVQEAALALIWKAGGRVFTVEAGEVLADDPDDPMRTAIRQILGVMHQLDKASISLRMRKGRAAKAKAGGYVGGAPAYGTRAESKELAAEKGEAEVIARMQAMHDRGLSLRAIAEQLNREGVPTKRSGAWSASTVARVLDPAARERARAQAAKAREVKRLLAT